MKLKDCGKILIALVIFLVGCSSSSLNQMGQSSAVATLDVNKILDRNPEIGKIKSQEKKIIEKIKKLDKESREIQEKRKKELNKIPDRNSLAYRDTDSQYRRQIEDVIGQIENIRSSYFQRSSLAYDKAYKEMMDVGLKMAKQKGASIVLPFVDLPDPHLDMDNSISPLEQFESYRMMLAMRPMVAAVARIDITGDVLKELNWKK